MSKNAFEAGERKVIPAVLVYVFYKNEVLLIHRNARELKDDFHAGFWNGLGGKLELNESPLQSACREVTEESGVELTPEQVRCLGVIQFPFFKPHKNEDWWVSVFVAEATELQRHTMLKSCHEGALSWVSTSEWTQLPMWPGDFLFLPQVISRKTFFGTIWYENRKVLRSEFF